MLSRQICNHGLHASEFPDHVKRCLVVCRIPASAPQSSATTVSYSSSLCSHGTNSTTPSSFTLHDQTRSIAPPVTSMETPYSRDFEHFSRVRDSIDVMTARAHQSRKPTKMHRGFGIGKQMFWSKRKQREMQVIENEAEMTSSENKENEESDPSGFQAWRVRDSIDIMKTRGAAWQEMQRQEMGLLRRVVFKILH